MGPRKTKSAFLVLFFGKLPSYFDLWARSCVPNHESFHWFVYNDTVASFHEFNEAVTMVPYSFAELVDDFRRVLDIRIPLSNTKAVCDYRTVLYPLRKNREDLGRYDFIGYTDLDMIYGRLNRFMPSDPSAYSMISADDDRPCGPFTLINRNFIDSICRNPGIRKRFEVTGEKLLGGAHEYDTALTKFAPVSGKTSDPGAVNKSNFGHLDESEELIRIAEGYGPSLCRADPIQPTMTDRINHRKVFAVWDEGTLTVYDNRGRKEEGGFFHFSRLKGRKKFMTGEDLSGFKKWGIYKYGSIGISSRLTLLKMKLSLLY